MTTGLYSRLCAEEKEKHLRGGGNTLQYRVIPYTILQYHLIQYNTIQASAGGGRKQGNDIFPSVGSPSP